MSFGNREDMVGPQLKRRSDFALIPVPIVDGFNALTTVTDRDFGNVRHDTELPQSASHRSSRVVEPPWRERLSRGLSDTSV
jgi:hypothetical protein